MSSLEDMPLKFWVGAQRLEHHTGKFNAKVVIECILDDNNIIIIVFTLSFDTTAIIIIIINIIAKPIK